MAYSNDYTGWLEEEPQVLFNYYLGQQPWQRQGFLGSRYGNIYGGFLGALGEQAMSGQEPIMAWSDYLKGIDWGGEWGKASPTQRGERQYVYNPSMKWSGF